MDVGNPRRIYGLDEYGNKTLVELRYAKGHPSSFLRGVKRVPKEDFYENLYTLCYDRNRFMREVGNKGWFLSNGYAAPCESRDGMVATDLAIDTLSENYYFPFRIWVERNNIDFRVKDKSYWKYMRRMITLDEIKCNFYESDGYSPSLSGYMNVLNKDQVIKYIRFHKILTQQSIFSEDVFNRNISDDFEHMKNRYGIEVAKSIELHMNDVFSEGEYTCCDNHAVAKLSRKAEMKHYRRAKSAGCCGRYDGEFKVKGDKYIFGFNYGH